MPGRGVNHVRAVVEGPDGKVCGGAYQSTQLFVCDPATVQTTVLGDHHPGCSGETYSFAVRGPELVCASCTNGAIVAYDPAKPWQCEANAMVDLQTGAATPFCTSPLGHRRAFTVAGDAAFFHSGALLLTAALPPRTP